MKWPRFCLFFLLIATVSRADVVKHGPVKQVTLPDGQIVVIAEGPSEPRSIGSYTVRLYSGLSKEFPFDDFLGGVIRWREGFVERIEIDDLDNNGELELIVIIRNAGSGSYLSADSFALTGRTVSTFESVQGLPSNSDPIKNLKDKVRATSALVKENRVASCGSVRVGDEKILPEKDITVSLNMIKEICISYGLEDLWAKIEKDPPSQPFKSDGCSLWFSTWNAVSLYSACFLHDLKYWAGYPDEDIARLTADSELMIDIACLTGSTTMAETMFQGTRRGGHDMFQQSFSWGFGRE